MYAGIAFSGFTVVTTGSSGDPSITSSISSPSVYATNSVDGFSAGNADTIFDVSTCTVVFRGALYPWRSEIDFARAVSFGIVTVTAPSFAIFTDSTPANSSGLFTMSVQSTGPFALNSLAARSGITRIAEVKR